MSRAALLMALAALALWAPSALADARIAPAEGVINEQQQFTITVTASAGAATQGLEVAFPGTVAVESVGDPPPGWSMETSGTEDDYTGATYRGGQMDAGEQVELTMLGTPNEVGTAEWTVEEILENGGTRLWSGPALTIQVYDRPPPPPTTAAAAPAGGGGGDGDDAAVWLGATAIVLAIGALVGAGLLWMRHPASPPDGG